MAKTYEINAFVFYCDSCGMVASKSRSEGEALKFARETAKAQGWKWEHPGWGLKCPNCQNK